MPRVRHGDDRHRADGRRPVRPAGLLAATGAASTLRLVLLGLALLVLTMPGGLHPAAAQQPLSIRGQVVNGTAGEALPGDLAVLMLVTGPDGQLRGTGQTLPDGEGRFRFDDVEPVEGGSYVLSVDYGGVFYGATLDLGELANDLALTVYESTQDVGVLAVERQVMVISDADEGERMASATEFVRLVNNSDRTLQPDLTMQGVISFLRFALPPNAADLTVQSDLRGGEVISIGTGFALTAPVPPGAHNVDFSYTFPYQSGSLSYRQSLPQGADIFQVLAPQNWGGVGVANLDPAAPVDIQGTTYMAWERRDIPPGPGVQLEVAGLPQPGTWSRLGGAVAGGAFWQAAIPSALGASLVALLAWGLARRSRPVAAASPLPDEGLEEAPSEAPGHIAGEVPGPADRRSLVQALAALDRQYESGAVPESDYRQQRERLVARALGEPGPDSGGEG